MGIAILCILMVLLAIGVFLFISLAIFRVGAESEKFESEEVQDEKDKNY